MQAESRLEQNKVIQHSEPVQVTHIKPLTGWADLKLNELWQYRDLLYYFIWRDVKIRYRQTILGAAWGILQPFLTMVVFSIFFGRLAKVPSDDLPYPVFAYAALVPWTFFANGITLASNSLVQNSSMLKKIYFPRMTMPISAVLTGLVDYILAFIVLFGMVLTYNITPTLNLLWTLPLLLLAFVTALGVSMWLSAMNVQFRDIRHVIPFLVQLWLFLTPIAYPSSLLDEPWFTLYGINPMAGVVEGFRWALLGTDTQPGPMIIVSSVMAVLILISGVFYFRRMERFFADVA